MASLSMDVTLFLVKFSILTILLILITRSASARHGKFWFDPRPCKYLMLGLELDAAPGLASMLRLDLDARTRPKDVKRVPNPAMSDALH